MAILFIFGLSVRAFEVIVISFAKFLVTCLVYKIYGRAIMTLAFCYLVLINNQVYFLTSQVG